MKTLLTPSLLLLFTAVLKFCFFQTFFGCFFLLFKKNSSSHFCLFSPHVLTILYVFACFCAYFQLKACWPFIAWYITNIYIWTRNRRSKFTLVSINLTFAFRWILHWFVYKLLWCILKSVMVSDSQWLSVIVNEWSVTVSEWSVTVSEWSVTVSE